MTVPATARPAPSARNVAFDVIRDVFGPPQRGAAESLDHRLRKAALDPRDRAFATELAYGTIERRRWLDWQLAPYIGERVAKLPPMILEILRLGTFQLRALRVHEYAAVSESVQLARRFGHAGTAGLVNAVLRRVASDPERPVDEAEFPNRDDFLGTRSSLPTWLVRHWRERFGEARLDAILDGVNGPAATGLAIDRRRTKREELIAALAASDIVAAPSPFARDAIVITGEHPIGTILAAAGERAEIHAEAACFPVDLLDPQPGSRIFEACSGRGNKTLQIAGAIDDRGKILAVDSDLRKIERAQARLDAAGLSSVELRALDATALAGLADFDYVLVDAPCSGIGIVGRQPEARWRKQSGDGARLAPAQAKILTAAAAQAAPGARLVYAVCSTDRREGEDVVDAFLAREDTFAREHIPERYAPFVTSAGDVLVPPGIDGRDGFFIAVLRRR